MQVNIFVDHDKHFPKSILQEIYSFIKRLPEEGKTYRYQPKLPAQPDCRGELTKELNNKCLNIQSQEQISENGMAKSIHAV